MNRRRWFFVWAVPLLWSVGCLAAFRYPGDEHALWAVGSVAAVWAALVFPSLRDIGSTFHILLLALPAGALTMALVGMLLDLVQAHRRFWLALLVLAATIVCVTSIGPFPSYARAVSRHGSLMAYVLFGFNLGLYATSAVSLVVFGVVRIWKCPFPAGHCRACGYDLTGNVSGACSECGASVDERIVPRVDRGAGTRNSRNATWR